MDSTTRIAVGLLPGPLCLVVNVWQIHTGADVRELHREVANRVPVAPLGRIERTVLEHRLDHARPVPVHLATTTQHAQAQPQQIPEPVFFVRLVVSGNTDPIAKEHMEAPVQPRAKFVLMGILRRAVDLGALETAQLAHVLQTNM